MHRDRLIVNGWFTLAVLVTLIGSCTRESDPTTDKAATIATPAVEPPASAPAPTRSPLDVLMTKGTLAEAIDHLRGQMTDTDEETSPGALLLALWAAEHLTWAEVEVTRNETSFAVVHKDSDASRGKRMCVRGTIIQIAKNELDHGEVFSGLLVSGYRDIASFIAAGSTGKLVQDSRARFCGVVIGRYDYSNSAGGKGHAISMVGMFDLAENRAR
jgi:hypothetical protein